MILFTKEIEKLAQDQYQYANDMEKQVIVAKFFNPVGVGNWYLMNQDPCDKDYCWGIVHLFDVEVGSFSKSELENVKLSFGLGIERDLYFERVNALEMYRKLTKIKA